MRLMPWDNLEDEAAMLRSLRNGSIAALVTLDTPPHV